MITETAYETLERISKIEDDEERGAALLQEFRKNNGLAIVVQRTYHPNYNFDLPHGPLPENIAKKSNHDEAGPFYNSLRKWNIFRHVDEVPENVQIKKHIREQQFIDLYESVSSGDAELLIAAKDKKLPWDTLSAEFVHSVVPQLFPDGVSKKKKVQSEPRPAGKSVPTVPRAEKTKEKSKKEICLDIMKMNHGLTRKDYIILFMEHAGVSKATAGLYYQSLKKEIE